ncbi:hypothetical protein WJX74_008541 [Apatococcus lobatus]|uniref:ELYS-like domain-containing protein n=1 Tax=Apatococcus lobatus TaxID=904363 RepID=A0AAW1RDT2_9CHLO
MATEVLRSLAATAPAEWFQYRGQDSRVLGQLVRRCVSTHRWSDLKRDEILQLYALFDLVLDNGLGSMIIDFIWEVCANPAMASSDPAEAYLMDWQCLRHWSKTKLVDVRQDVQHQLSARLPASNQLVLVSRLHARITQLEPILKILATPHQGSTSPPEGLDNDVDYCECRQLQLCIKVLQELVASGVDLQGAAGRHGSQQEWRRSIDRRRDAAGHHPLFLSTLLSRLVDQGMKIMTYPPSSLSAALNTIFMYNPAKLTSSNQHARLALLLYLLLDLGMPATSATFRRAFGVSPSDFSCWQAAFWLDDSWAATSKHEAANLDEACSLLSGAASPSTPLSFPEALAARGRPHDALLVLRASELSSAAAQSDDPFQEDLSSVPAPGVPAAELKQTSATPGLLGLTGYGRRNKAPTQASSPAAAGPSNESRVPCAASQGQGAMRLRRVKLEVQVKLQAGLMQEALACAHSCISVCSAEDQSRWTTEIVDVMLRQAAAAQSLGRILQLPFSNCMQQAVIAWLEHQLQDGNAAASQLPLFYLQRGKLNQALQAYDVLKSSEVTVPEAQALQLDSLMTAASKIAPEARLC